MIEQLSEAQIKSLVSFCRTNGITAIIASYEGYGDSGDVSSVDDFDETNKLLNLLSYEQRDLIRDLAYRALQDNFPGWEIDEGSFGEYQLTITPATLEEYIEHHVRYTETETHNVNVVLEV